MNSIYLHCPYKIYKENIGVLDTIRENAKVGDKIIMVEESASLKEMEDILKSMGYKVIIYKSIYNKLGVLYEAQIASIIKGCDKFIGVLGRYDLPSLPFLTAAKYIEKKNIIIKVL